MLTPITLAFLRELGINNHTERMHAHCDLYLQERANFEQLISGLLEKKKKSDPHYAEVTVKQCLFRINKDIRFSKDKSPYKPYFSAYIGPEGKKSRYGGIYIHIQPDHHSIVGGGIYRPSPAQLKILRTHLSRDPSRLDEIVSASSFVNHYGHITGRMLDKYPRGFDPTSPGAHRLKYQDLFVEQSFSDTDILAPNFPDIIRQYREALEPLNRYLGDVLGD